MSSRKNKQPRNEKGQFMPFRNPSPAPQQICIGARQPRKEVILVDSDSDDTTQEFSMLQVTTENITGKRTQKKKVEFSHAIPVDNYDYSQETVEDQTESEDEGEDPYDKLDELFEAAENKIFAKADTSGNVNKRTVKSGLDRLYMKVVEEVNIVPSKKILKGEASKKSSKKS